VGVEGILFRRRSDLNGPLRCVVGGHDARVIGTDVRTDVRVVLVAEKFLDPPVNEAHR
jgi:hypothetical protein